jgi:hypothetical protein
MKKSVFFSVLFSLLAFPAALVFAQTAAAVKRLDAESRRIDAFAKKNRRAALVFADVSPTEKPEWRRFASEAALEKFRETTETYTIALVWRRQARVVNAVFTLFSESGDWARYDSHYFRADGSVAKVSSELRTFYGDLIILRDFYFDRRGRLLKKTVRYRDLNTKKPVKKPAGDYYDNEIAIYKTTKKLPFAGAGK